MATVDIQITDGGTAVGSGWTLVYGDSGTGIEETDADGKIHLSSVASTYQVALAYVVKNPAGTLTQGGAGFYMAAGGTYTLGM